MALPRFPARPTLPRIMTTCAATLTRALSRGPSMRPRPGLPPGEPPHSTPPVDQRCARTHTLDPTVLIVHVPCRRKKERKKETSRGPSMRPRPGPPPGEPPHSTPPVDQRCARTHTLDPTVLIVHVPCRRKKERKKERQTGGKKEKRNHVSIVIV